MFNSIILDVLVGLLFSFLAVSLIVSSVTEAISSAIGWRANVLLSGVKLLVNDPSFQGVAKGLYNHALVNPISSGTAATENALTAKPSYIEPLHFAGALLDVLGIPAKAPEQIEVQLERVSDPQLRQTLQGLLSRSDQTPAGFQIAIARWFEAAMDRVSGQYKRRTQVWSFVLAFLVCAVLNIDALHLARAIWLHPAVVEEIAPPHSLSVQSAMAAINSLDVPIGWTGKIFAGGSVIEVVVLLVLGWLIVAFATLFGAPFWFGAIQGLANLRGAGPKPGSKS